jgi:hypothetical protein
MKRALLVIFAATAFLVFAKTGMGFPVQVVDSSFHVWGEAYGSSYDTSSSSPVDGSCSGIITIPDYPPWDAQAFASSHADVFSAWARAGKDYMGSAIGYADTLVTFRPLSSASETMSFGFDWIADDGVAHWNAELIDVTGGTSLWTADWWGSGGHWNREESLTYDFDTGHLYRLHFTLMASIGDPGVTWAEAGTSSLERVPEPAALLFLGIGLIGIPVIRRRFRK